MCGFTGFVDTRGRYGADELASIASQMADAVRHRGPDDQGVWTDVHAGVALGHRRLSVLDLSPCGHQPMESASGRYVLIFNGEIYNFQVLRAELETTGQRFRGNSDTEVMLAAFERWGIEGSVERFLGMFAFAVWDRSERVLYLARDRMGEKPLYYGWAGGSFLFGSELKALRKHPGWQGAIDRRAVMLFMRHACVPSPYSIYEGIQKLPPGTTLALRPERGRSLPKPAPYWSVKDVVEKGRAAPFRGGDGDAIERLDYLLRDAVRQQMVADVPLGAFLSGGIDSSTIVALMQAQSDQPVRTFSIGFHEQGFDEAVYARAVARHLGTDHTELYVESSEARAVLPQLPALYDEPFADVSQIPTFLVAQLARKDVTVSLSGDAGDELFAGYNRYLWTRRISRSVGWLPRRLRRGMARALGAAAPAQWERGVARYGAVLPGWMKQAQPADKVQKLARVLNMWDPDTIYRTLVSQWQDPGSVVIGAAEPTTVLTTPEEWPRLPDLIERMQYLDTVTYLPDDILVKVDRAAMAVGLETRVPFLDHRVVEFAWTLPRHMKIRDGQGKWLLRQVLNRYVPAALIERPKMGFSVPIGDWLRGPLREWAEALLERSGSTGILDAENTRAVWMEHLSGRRNRKDQLWTVLMFQAWLEHTHDTGQV